MTRGRIGLGALAIMAVASCGDDDGGPGGGDAGAPGQIAGNGAGGEGATGGVSPTEGGAEAAGGGSITDGGTWGREAGAPGAAGEGGGSITGTAGDGMGGTVGEGGAGGAGGSSSPLQWLGKCTPLAFARDAKTVLGEEGVWTAETGWQALPDLPGGTAGNTPRALSRDGAVVFGNSGSALGNEMYRWTVAGGIEGLGVTYLPFAASLDGSVVVGWTTDNADEDAVPFRWTSTDGFAAFDSPEFDPIFSSSNFIDAHLSAAGDIAHFSRWRDRARWTSADGYEILYGRIPRAVAMSADGTRIASVETGSPGTHVEATGSCIPLDYDEPPYPYPPLASPRGCGEQFVDSTYVMLYDYDDSGTRGVGTQFNDAGNGEPFYWSEKAGMWPLIELLPDGLKIRRSEPPDWRTSTLHPYLSGDGQVVLAQNTAGECFISEIDEPTDCFGCSSEPDVEYLGRCVPYELSDDGNTVLAEQGIWTAQTGWVSSGTLRLLSGDGKVAVSTQGLLYDFNPDGTFALSGDMMANVSGTVSPLAISHDGSLILAWHDSGGPGYSTSAAYWTQGTGLVDIKRPAGSGPWVQGLSALMDAAGSAGYFSSSAPEYFKWSVAAPTQLTLQGASVATALNDDGSQLALVKFGNTGNLAYDVQATGTCLFADDPGAPAQNPCAMSTVVITDYDASGTRGVGWEWYQGYLYAAFYWSAAGGMQRLDEVTPSGAGIESFPAAAVYSEAQLYYIGLEAHPHISSDGTKVLSLDYQGRCFLTTIAP